MKPTNTSVDSVSISEIVRMHISHAKDPWKLAIVQRNLVWDDNRIARLLDSLVAGYPIGHLLLCKTHDSTNVLTNKGKRRISICSDDSWQLLDGQQRCNALATMFLGLQDGGEGKQFYIKLNQERPELKPGKKDDKINQYIVWGDHLESPFSSFGNKNARNRNEWFSLSCLGNWLLENRNHDNEALLSMTYSSFKKWLNKIDRDYTELSKAEHKFVLNRVYSLIQLWSARWIPVQKIRLTSADDILQVFSRTNMEGVNTGAIDIFFAGVKTHWSRAEEVLFELCEDVPILNRLTALRLIARIASFDLKNGDIIPLELGKLKSAGGMVLIEEMESTARKEKESGSMKALSDYLIHDSGLGYGLRNVDSHLFDHVLCWASQHPSPDPKSYELMAAYLFWTTAFRIYPIFREGFSREAMKIAYQKGKESTQFPLEQILEMVVTKWPQLSYRRAAVMCPYHPSGRTNWNIARDVVNERGYMFLSVAQSIEYEPETTNPPHRVDWDHIYPKALRHRMKWKGKDNELIHQHHEDTWNIWRIGNQCGLDSSLNRSLQDKPPQDKSMIIQDQQKDGSLWPVDLFISGSEWQRLVETDKLLDAKEIETAMINFRDYIVSREKRLWQYAVEHYPYQAMYRDVLFKTTKI